MKELIHPAHLNTKIENTDDLDDLVKVLLNKKYATTKISKYVI